MLSQATATTTLMPPPHTPLAGLCTRPLNLLQPLPTPAKTTSVSGGCLTTATAISHTTPTGHEFKNPPAHLYQHWHFWYPSKPLEGPRISLLRLTNTGVSICCSGSEGQSHSAHHCQHWRLNTSLLGIIVPSKTLPQVFPNKCSLIQQRNHRHH